MTSIRFLALFALALPVALSAQETAAQLDAAARTITEADYIRRVGIMADDSMMGRNTPSPGLEMTAAYIAGEFQRFGLRGGLPDGSFVQRYPLRSLAVDASSSYLRRGDTRLEFGPDMLPFLADVTSGEATGGLAIASGSGNVERALADNTVAGRHVILVLPRDLPGMTQDIFQTVVAIARAGAISVFVTNSSSNATWGVSARALMATEVSKGWTDSGRPDGRFLPGLQIRDGSVERLLAGSGLDFAAFQARSGAPLRIDQVPGPNATLALHYVDQQLSAPNVVAILEGSDPALRDEYVVVSAHMDHIGAGAPGPSTGRLGAVAGDTIYNGADDNASGTTAVIEIAEAMSSLATPPKRSIMFLLVSGEEKGLWGSEYFSTHAPVPIDQMVADLNTDMVGRNWPDTIVAIGKDQSDLGETLERVNAAHPELGMTAINDLWPEQSYYTRSDHYNFAQRGVPILFFFNGEHEDYHRPGDEVDKINGEKAARIARLVFYLGVDVANAAERPEWDPQSYRRIVGGTAGGDQP
jgi:hypothetical protein